MKRLLAYTSTSLLLATTAFAVSPEKAQEYLDRVIEITDVDRTVAITADEIIAAFALEGLAIAEENHDEAREILTEPLKEVLPATIQSQKPFVEEIYTEEELDALIAFMDTEIGASAMSKDGELGARAAILAQEQLEPVLIQVIPRLFGLMEQ